MSKQKTINVEPFHLKSKIQDGIITMTFHDHNKLVNIKLKRWWIEFIARDMHKILADEQAMIDRLKESMKSG